MKRFLAAAALAASLAGAAHAQEVATQVPAPPSGAVVMLHTTMGDIEVTLDPAGAPKTAEQFLALANKGYFDGAIVYRVEPGFVIQFGDLDAKLQYRDPKLPGVPLETANNRHSRGALSFARSDDLNSGNGVLFISLDQNSGLDATAGAAPNTTGYAVFGHVSAGMNIVDAIAGVELAPEGGPFPGKLPKTPVLITKAEITKPG
jgi:cyclophilin family peptidyl-prolyl cis-trans isomerase